ncbi:MAG: hypothetical protein F6K48_12965 [Okeania sp. SIO3H1]|uniref:hypothetical protein n=1 Tax=Okeania sp. SIO1I7 TaxID=2607772 RepID=UPI0013CCB32C|nr:hypothetical protein [Okeania sp. SIO1I7]NEN89766.1 hypothetical protein [Okeania sp. SIO3H1]NET27382.1 hypothetical protein [Okeania sp. SIO1I7]
MKKALQIVACLILAITVAFGSNVGLAKADYRDTYQVTVSPDQAVSYILYGQECVVASALYEGLLQMVPYNINATEAVLVYREFETQNSGTMEFEPFESFRFGDFVYPGEERKVCNAFGATGPDALTPLEVTVSLIGAGQP